MAEIDLDRLTSEIAEVARLASFADDHAAKAKVYARATRLRACAIERMIAELKGEPGRSR